ncbi:hypothetical protein WJX84_006626 [Apatococcus fuscideae]|uniref:Uncharacterized protein n=1 Tax=Apatococcus fuscideae TaxID=2026836 RepID=A0AAW1T886_9CHLO
MIQKSLLYVSWRRQALISPGCVPIGPSNFPSCSRVSGLDTPAEGSDTNMRSADALEQLYSSARGPLQSRREANFDSHASQKLTCISRGPPMMRWNCSPFRDV